MMAQGDGQMLDQQQMMQMQGIDPSQMTDEQLQQLQMIQQQQ